MIIDRIDIAKFHGFKNVGFRLGRNITIIAGQNGTQKTTLLGLMSQAFTIAKESEMYKEKPLCGGSYKSGFKDKFNLSPKFDKPGEHEWTVSFLTDDEPYTVISMYRDKKKGDDIRFWQKGSREKGSGYPQYPVIFLSLKRLIPLAEESSMKTIDSIEITDQERLLFKELHNNILFCFDNILETNLVASPNKLTLGVTTDKYDWMQNSAGQDNVGKIILALLSFKRLFEQYKKTYKGGLLFIDELDATMYPGSQRKLLEVLNQYSNKYKIQIVFTTHSLTLLRLGYSMLQEAKSRKATENNFQIIYLEKKDGDIQIQEQFPYAAVENRIQNITSPKKTKHKVTVYTEDAEAISVIKALLNGTGCISRLEFSKCKFGNGNLINLMQSKLPCFMFPSSIIVFDGDVKSDAKSMENLAKIRNNPNWLFLPTLFSPERWIANYLVNLSDNDPLWSSINLDYNRQVCFGDRKPEKIAQSRDVAKLWFQEQSSQYPYWTSKIIRHWIKASPENSNVARDFTKSFISIFNSIAQEIRIEEIKSKIK